MASLRDCARPLLWLSLALSGLALPAKAEPDEAVVLDARRYPVFAGRYSVFATFQARLREKLDDCGRSDIEIAPRDAPPTGRLGPETVEAIKALAACGGAGAQAEGSLAREGVLTERVWRSVMGDAPIPDATLRAHTMVLSFEGTDFGDRPEWNLCQDGMRQGPRGRVACFNSSDPCSFLTWGPRGATAGWGREIQHILAALEQRNRALLKSAFGSEYATLARFYRAKSGQPNSCTGPIPLKILVCSIWMTPERRNIWENALQILGRDAQVREIYDQLYSAQEFDGLKMKAFFELWNALGLPPSEVDYAFFLDRITHLGCPPGPAPEVAEKMRACIAGENGAISRHGAARRCLARMQLHATQPDYRSGRDVAYYLDAYREGALPEQEIKLWAAYMTLSAVHNFGLRDEQPVRLVAAPTLRALGMELPPEADGQVLPSEIARCPVSVLTPARAP